MFPNDNPKCSLAQLKQRAFLLTQIREFFASRGVLEVETPLLSSSGNSDVSIESFTSQSINPTFNKSYLRTSAEFPMKRLICAGSGDIYEIGKVFRQKEIGSSHNPEFTMLEWYRIDYDYIQLIQDVEELFKSVFLTFGVKCHQSIIMTFKQCFKKYLRIDCELISLKKLNTLCQSYNYDGSALSYNEALDYLFATQIQPMFQGNRLTFVTLYPASQAALAQINPDDGKTALRFEVFYQGYELGNGYQELTDGDELEKRFIHDNQLRVKQQKVEIQLDNQLLDATKQGMPKCSGIAIGIDRLLMSLVGCNNIKEIISFNSQAS